ncbi:MULTISPECIES: hypothetical protein [unclassified Streptomyces]|uniref:hypothetical protein n=1 Tax=unclassified Streptomyces TaxID=2593676 RepID=UPI00081E61A3|nr:MULTISPECIES: hypothetical protein [unclassified Streptomyces]MYR95479.1 hypothetical protein [Streptomyces sp. SID4937]SCD91107.1 hypothetical protein GA0115243_104765 [Streptomyces sp. ScaeMP-e83]
MSEKTYMHAAVAPLPNLPDALVAVQWARDTPGVLVTMSGPGWLGVEVLELPDLRMPHHPYRAEEPLPTEALERVLQSQPDSSVFAAMVLESITDRWEWWPASAIPGADRERLHINEG